MSQIKLPNGCYCSQPKVFPSNWDKPGADVSLPWRIKYRFYDPSVIDGNGNPIAKQVVIKAGINRFKTLKERRDAVRFLVDEELKMLKDNGANPITKQEITLNIDYVVQPNTPFLEALQAALSKLDCEHKTKLDIQSILRYFGPAARVLRCDSLPISRVTRKEIILTLDQCGRMKKEKWSNNTYNHYRKYLMILFKKLVQLMAIDINPVREIEKKSHAADIRETISISVRREIDRHLKRKKLLAFRLFNRIFFHSGGRLTELVKLKGINVNLEEQWFKITIKKGGQHRQVKKTIRTCALPYWKLIMKNCRADDFVFGHGLVPGKEATKAWQITRRWERHVKATADRGGLSIPVDYYAAHKHGNSTETSAKYSNELAAGQNDHTSTAMVRNIYDIGYSARRHAELMKVVVNFV